MTDLLHQISFGLMIIAAIVAVVVSVERIIFSGVNMRRAEKLFEVLAGFASAVFLVVMAGLMAVGSVERLFSPQPIDYRDALAGVPGITVVGGLPKAVEIITTFSGSVAATSPAPAAVRALLAFWRSPACDALKREHGMEPA
mgnify:CR=1 FL=1